MRQENQTSLNELIVEKCVSLRNEGRHGTEYNYRTLLHYVESHYGIVKMKEVNPQWAKNLHSTLSAEGKSAATIKNYFALLQAVTNYGAYLGLTKGDTKLTRSKPYELNKVKLAKPKTRKTKWLPKEDMQKVWGYWCKTESNCERKWIGLFLASYLCNGANIADVARLRYDDEYYNSGKKVFGFYRQKTKNTSGAYVRVPITDRLAILIHSIGNEEKKGEFVFGKFTDKIDRYDELAMNKRVMMLNTFGSKVLRNAANKIGIRDDVSYTFARHSYISCLNHSGFNFAAIEEAVGHSLNSVADNYIAETPIEKLFEMNNSLL